MGRAGGAVVAAGPALAALRAVIPTRGRPTIPIRQPLAAAHRGARAGRSLTLRAMAAPALMAAAGSLDAPHKAQAQCHIGAHHALRGAGGAPHGRPGARAGGSRSLAVAAGGTRASSGWGPVDSSPRKAQPAWMSCYATCFPGLEEVVARELASPAIGARNIVPAKAGVEFAAPSVEVAYRANLWLRSAIRVLVKLAEGELDPNNSGAEEIYDFARNAVDWSEHLYDRELHFSVAASTASCTDIRSSMLVSTRVKDAVCDAVRSSAGWKPQPAPKGEQPVLQIVANTFQDRITLYRNMSGDSLHRRGYREAMHKAALNESTAAGVLLWLGWDELCDAVERPVLVDPMCGSGTFLVEAALIATRRAPGLTRTSWPFQSWHDFDAAAWDSAVASAQAARRLWGGRILGSDVHEGALWLAKNGVEGAGVADIVKLKLAAVEDLELPCEPTLVVSNPPWGQRLDGGDRGGRGGRGGGPDDGLVQTWIELGMFLKRECRNATVGILNGENRALTKELCLKADRRIPLSVGGVDARLLKYHILPPKGSPPRATPSAPASAAPISQESRASAADLRQSSQRLMGLLSDDHQQ
eukprot:jgi/Tetstr1/431400/TSEL_021090.t1